MFYTFGLAAICWAIWKARNKACFEKKLIKHPAETMCHACALMSYWAGLYGAEFQARMAERIGMLLSTACRILISQRAPPRLLPAAAEENDPDEEI